MTLTLTAANEAPGLHVRPIELKDAQNYIRTYHRHHQPPVGHRFSIGLFDANGIMHGTCVVGRPVARLAGHPSDVAEVTRLCTDGVKNGCSILYAAAARACAALGFIRIQTYTLPSEGGTSLRAAGWINAGEAGGGQWKHTDGKPRRTDQPIDTKWRWEKHLNIRTTFSELTFDIQTEQEMLPL